MDYKDYVYENSRRNAKINIAEGKHTNSKLIIIGIIIIAAVVCWLNAGRWHVQNTLDMDNISQMSFMQTGDGGNVVAQYKIRDTYKCSEIVSAISQINYYFDGNYAGRNYTEHYLVHLDALGGEGAYIDCAYRKDEKAAYVYLNRNGESYNYKTTDADGDNLKAIFSGQLKLHNDMTLS